MHFGSGHLFVRRAVKAQLADSQLTFRHYRGAKGAASHGTSFIEITGPGVRVECRAWLVIGKIIPLLRKLVRFIKQAGRRITRKFGGKPSDGLSSTFAEASSTFRISQFEVRQPPSQAESIQLIDGKYSDATLGAARATNQPFAASAHGIGQRSVNDLN
jgi:hypothetical protein